VSVLRTSRQPASQDEAEAALSRLDQQPGIYFGVEMGVPGLHPLQARLLTRPALVLRLFGDGIEVQAISALGRQWLQQPALRDWHSQALRGPDRSVEALLRAFMSALGPSPDILLMGALPFAVHRLAGPEPGREAMGVLFLAEAYLARDANGLWEEVVLGLEDAAAPDPLPAQRENPDQPAGGDLDAPKDDFEPGGYAQMVQKALVQLKHEPLVSLTLSQCFRRAVTLSPAAAFRRLRQANPAPASFFVNDGTGEWLFGASPDLQLMISGGMVHSMPVCGTVARRAGAVGEAESLRELLNEEVDAASLAVCTDALRNDLAPLCEPGSLRLLDRRRPMSLATVIHTVDRIEGRLREGKDAWDAILATAAPVMVTGYPRQRALAAIEQLEASPRGWYGGMVVQMSGNGDALVGTILRAAAVRDGIAQVRTGGDLMANSSPEREEQEWLLKSRSLWRAFGLENDAPPRPSGPANAAPPAVALLDGSDPFAAAVADCLRGFGVVLDPYARVALGAGIRADLVLPPSRMVAIGDAATRLLGREGFAVQAITPEQGRPVLCIPQGQACGMAAAPFTAARYLRFAPVLEPMQPGWEAWARDEAGHPQALAHPGLRLVCLLFRPESLLSEPGARDMLSGALRWCGAGATPD